MKRQPRSEFDMWRIDFSATPVEILPGHFWEPTQMGGVWTDKEGTVLDSQEKPKKVWAMLERLLELNAAMP